ncbi:Signal transduction histidine kinase [Catalinimonas alkaloidigena]|uniref:histidine kinase n=1 Tax=Catalinimonas alkaloidigena TaxID=1075417 RepID=A0A1G8XME9_9BACT|nr:histidine kinase N-terminal 7TM domain-containing protein [Catalinimonas alkaloidigena]SDJ91673.1 Signal transduction histidine kinase [Catalinimonas alkaloidigena]
MHFSLNVFALTLFFASLVIAGFAFVLVRQPTRAIRWFSALLFAIVVWTFFYGCQVASTTVPTVQLFMKLLYLGIAPLPFCIALFVINFVGKEKWLTPLTVGLLLVEPVVTLLLVWTSPWHDLYYQHPVVHLVEPVARISFERGPWYYVHFAYFYALLVGGNVLLLAHFRKADPLYRKQSLLIFASNFIPWGVNVLYFLGIRLPHGIDPTPYAFFCTVVLVSIGFLRFQLFDIVPVARGKMIEVMREGVLVLDRKGRIVDANPQLKAWVAPRTSPLIGQTLPDLFPGEAALHRLQTTRVDTTLPLTLTHGPTARYLEVIATPLREKGDVYGGQLLLFRDVTEQTVALEKLQEQAHELAALNQLKDRLFSIISHDLRSPMASLMSLINLAESDDVTDVELKLMMASLSQNVGYTMEMLENLLSWSKNQLKGDLFQPVTFELHSLARPILPLLEKKAHDKQITLHNRLAGNPRLRADKNMMDLVLRNLLSNAIKFCHSGGQVTLTAEVGDTHTTLCVRDTGIGIPAEVQPRLFGTHNISTKGTHNEKGTGLGLPLCREFVEKNGGMIWVESAPGQGSHFYFTIPNAVPESVVS